MTNRPLMTIVKDQNPLILECHRIRPRRLRRDVPVPRGLGSRRR